MIDNDYREVDTDEKNVSDVEETKEGTPVETGEVVTDDSTEDNEKTDDFVSSVQCADVRPARQAS